MQTLVLISLFTLCVWLLYSALRYGTGEYVSDNYYIANEKWLFSVVMILTAGLLLLPMLSKSDEYGCFAFLSCMGVTLVGTEPHYKTYGRLAHNVGAWTACASALIWSALFHPYITACVVFAYLAYYIAVGKKVMYVGEVIVFALVYFNLLF